jgi:hypothetical protein
MQLPVRRPDECIVNMDLHHKSNIGDCIHEKRSILPDRSVQTESDKQIYILFNSFVNFRLTRIDLELLILLNYILTKKSSSRSVLNGVEGIDFMHMNTRDIWKSRKFRLLLPF